jgi:hypothetical protein
LSRLRILAVLSVTLVSMAGASPVWAGKSVTSVGVKQGETGMEWKGEYVFDQENRRNGAWKQKLSLAHGVTSFWQTEIEANIARGGARRDDTEFSSLDWKNKFQFTSQKEYWMDSGVRFSYALNGTGEADAIEIKLLAGKDIAKTAHRANLSYSREVGEDSNDDAEWDLAWHSRYKYSDYFQPGFELYSEFGEIGNETRFNQQNHRIGPVFSGALPLPGAAYDAGYLFGLSNAAPDGTVKFILKYKW